MSALLTSLQFGEVFLLRTTATNPSKFIFYERAFGRFKIHDFRQKGQIGRIKDASPLAQALVLCNRGV
jgi:hypothetical protein